VSDRPDGGDLSPELRALRLRMFAAAAAAETIVVGLSDEQCNRRPAPGRWSIAECIDHLNVVGDKLIRAIDPAIERAHREGRYARGPFRYGRLGAWFVRSTSGEPRARRRRYRTFSVYEPRRVLAIDRVLADFKTLQENLAERAEACDGLDLARIKVTSPATRWVRMSLGLWLEMVAGHQERHLAQAREVREQLFGGAGDTAP
jgi:hypothetical protein